MIPTFFKTSLACCLLFFVTTLAVAAADAAEGPPDNELFTGSVLDTMNAAGYTYIKIDTEDGQIWAALPESVVKVGDTISIVRGMEMKDFHSNALDKTFPKIFFSPGISESAGSSGPNPHQTPVVKQKAGVDPFSAAIAAERQNSGGQQVQPVQGSSGSMGAIVPFKELSVEKATGENAYTVEEIFAKAKELDGQTVRVKAHVVKYNANIMGRNWLHLQDGTGDPMENSHDLVVTTKEEVASPEVVTIQGKLTADKDFGAGYKYQVIIENGTISR